jgi:hypothetical protein
MVLTPLRESHSARGNQRIYAPKGPPEAISPGGPLHLHDEIEDLRSPKVFGSIFLRNRKRTASRGLHRPIRHSRESESEASAEGSVLISTRTRYDRVESRAERALREHGPFPPAGAGHRRAVPWDERELA